MKKVRKLILFEHRRPPSVNTNKKRTFRVVLKSHLTVLQVLHQRVMQRYAVIFAQSWQKLVKKPTENIE